MEPSPQSAELCAPYIRVGRDERGGGVWEVVGLGYVVRTVHGHKALEILEQMVRSNGVGFIP